MFDTSEYFYTHESGILGASLVLTQANILVFFSITYEVLDKNASKTFPR